MYVSDISVMRCIFLVELEQSFSFFKALIIYPDWLYLY